MLLARHSKLLKQREISQRYRRSITYIGAKAKSKENVLVVLARLRDAAHSM